MFTFKVDKNNIKMIESETVTSGSVNVYDCQFIFSEEWEGLSKTVAFKAGDVAVASILNDGNTCKIPWEVLKTDGADLFVGIKGTAGTETEGIDDDVILPTVWAYIGIIRKGATDGTDPLPPSPSVYEQILIEIRKLEDGKQDRLTAGEGIEISADNVISCTVAPYDDTEIRGEITAQGAAINANSKAIADNSDAINRLNNDINTKQNKLAAGEGIEISADNVISCTVKPYNDSEIRGELTTQGETITAQGATINSQGEAIRANSEAITAQGEAIRANSKTIADNSDAINRLNNDINTKQNKITGVKGQIVGFDDNGEPVAQDGGAGEPGKDGTTFTPTVSESGVISWTNDGGLVNPDPVNIKGTPGNDGVTFTPTVSGDGVISWSNDGGLANPDPVNIKGPAGAYTAGAGISISNDIISLSDTASTKKLATGSLTSFGGVTVTSVNDFTLKRQTSNLSLISEYIHTDATSYTEFKTYYGYLEAYLTADADKTLSSTIPMYLNMSHSISFPGAVGFGIIKVSTMSRYIALAESSGGIIRLYPTQSISVTSGANITVYLYLH